MDTSAGGLPQRRGGRGTRFAERVQIITTARALHAAGWSWVAIARALGLTAKTLARLLARWHSAEAIPALRPVTLAPIAPQATLTLVSPTGWRLEGLTPEAAARLLAALPC